MIQIQKQPERDAANPEIDPALLGAALAVSRGQEPDTFAVLPPRPGDLNDEQMGQFLRNASRTEATIKYDARVLVDDAELATRVELGESRIGLSRLEQGIRKGFGKIGLRGANVGRPEVQVMQALLSVHKPSIDTSHVKFTEPKK